MRDQVVVDASLAFKWLSADVHSEKAHALLQSWEARDTELAVPYLLPFEVSNALHRRVARGELGVAESGELLGSLLSSRLKLHSTPSLHNKAIELASLLKQGAAYDAHYLALAEWLGCELWTADRKFHLAAGTGAGTVRWIGDFSVSSQ